MNRKWLILAVILILVGPIAFYLYSFLLGCTYDSSGIFYTLDKFIQSSFLIISIFIFILPLTGLISLLMIIRKLHGFQKILAAVFILFGICFLVLAFLANSSMTTDARNNYSVTQSILASIKTDLSQSISKDYQDTDDSCDTPDTIFETDNVKHLLQSLQQYSSHSPHCFSNNQAWAVTVQLPNSGGSLCRAKTQVLCVDSRGYSGQSFLALKAPMCWPSLEL